MKKIILTTIALLYGQVALGHGDHPPKIATCAKECTKAEIEAAVPNAINTLVESGRIQGSWTSAKIKTVEQKNFAKGPEWVATILDEKIKDTSKQKLFVFITKKGYLNGSNYTGN
jgi:hypothetical protein